MLTVGFTGTRRGMTSRQRQIVRDVLQIASEAHHGDCVGADMEFHLLCVEAGIPVVIHPPIETKYRAFCLGQVELPPEKFLKRNHDIVDVSQFMIGCPSEVIEPKPSRGQGTWSTIRYARKTDTPLMIVYP